MHRSGRSPRRNWRLAVVLLVAVIAWTTLAGWLELYDDHYVQHRAGSNPFG